MKICKKKFEKIYPYTECGKGCGCSFHTFACKVTYDCPFMCTV